MNIETKDEFPRDYASEIALECDKLENILQVSLEGYDNSHQFLGKSNWYTIALEDNDSDKEKDSASKKNILLRMIDHIVNFIKMVGRKIAEWYRACRAAIVKFFAKETVDPTQVTTRLSTLVEGLTSDDAAQLVSKMSQENKTVLAEILDKDYIGQFSSMYKEYTTIGDKASDVHKFSQNYEFFTQYEDKHVELKEIATKNKIYETVDDKLKKVLTGQMSADHVKDITGMFNAAGDIHEHITVKLENLLKKIPHDELSAIEGNDPDSKRRHAVELLSSVIKINSEIVLKINRYMQAISLLMTYIVKYRTKKIVFIPM